MGGEKTRVAPPPALLASAAQSLLLSKEVLLGIKKLKNRSINKRIRIPGNLCWPKLPRPVCRRPALELGELRSELPQTRERRPRHNSTNAASREFFQSTCIHVWRYHRLLPRSLTIDNRGCKVDFNSYFLGMDKCNSYSLKRQ